MSRALLGLVIGLMLTVAGCGVEWLPSGGNTLEPTPADFSFDPKLCQLPAIVVTSAEIEVTGVTGQATVKVKNGEFSVNGGDFTTTTSFVTPTADQKIKVRVRHTTAAASAASNIVITQLSVGNTSGFFYSTVNNGQTECR